MLMKPRALRWFHGVATVTWAALTVPTVLWWRESIFWIALMSAWANFASHFSAWQATRTEVKQDDEQKGGS